MLVLPTNLLCVKEMLAESSKSAPKAIFYEGIGPAEKVFHLYFLMDAEFLFRFDVANKRIQCETNAGRVLENCTKSTSV